MSENPLPLFGKQSVPHPGQHKDDGHAVTNLDAELQVAPQVEVSSLDHQGQNCPTNITFQEVEPHNLMPGACFTSTLDTRSWQPTKGVLRALSFATCIGLFSLSIVQNGNNWPFDRRAIACPPVPISHSSARYLSPKLGRQALGEQGLI